MKNEAEFKSVFKRSIRTVKGFSLSLAAPMFAGVPDLYVIVPGYMPVLLEAKWLGDIGAHNFNRKIEYSPMQKVWMKAACSVQNYAAMGLVGFKFKEETCAVLVYEGIERINYGFDIVHPYTTYKDKKFDVATLFKSSKIPLMPLTSATFYANNNVELNNVIGDTNDR